MFSGRHCRVNVDHFFGDEVKTFAIHNQRSEHRDLRSYITVGFKNLLEAVVSTHLRDGRDQKISSKLTVEFNRRSSENKVEVIEKEFILKAVKIPFPRTSTIHTVLEDILVSAENELEKSLEMESDFEFSRPVSLHAALATCEMIEGVKHTQIESTVKKYCRFQDCVKAVPFTVYVAPYNERARQKSLGFYIHCQFDEHLNKYIHYEEKDPEAKDTVKKSLNLLFDEIREYNSRFEKTEHAQSFFPVILHGKHNILADLTTSFGLDTLSVIGKTVESFINIEMTIPSSKIVLRFMNSFHHLPFHHENLKDILKNSEKLKAFKSQFKDIEDFNLFLENDDGIHVSDYRYKPRDIISFPENLYNSEGNQISKDQYENCKIIWEKYGIKRAEDFESLLQKFKVTLIADMFQSYREECLESFKMDPSYYETMPAFAWNAMTGFTKVELEEIKDPEMNVIKRHIKGPLVHSNIQSNSENKFSWRGQMNNLNGYALCQPLPFKDFKWVPLKEITDDFVQNILKEADHQEDNESTGYFLEVTVNTSKLIDAKKTTQSSKQLFHYRNLALGVKNGLILEKVHRIISFTQKPWMKSFILHNIEKEESGSTILQRKIFQQMNKAVFENVNLKQKGNMKLVDAWEDHSSSDLSPEFMKSFIQNNIEKKKTQSPFAKLVFQSFNNGILDQFNQMQTGRTSKPLETKNDVCFEKDARVWVTHPNYKRIVPLNNVETFAIVEMELENPESLKPSYVEFAMSELTKFAMLEFHYGYMKNKFQERATLAYIRHDSVMYTIEGESNFYETIKGDLKDRFDTSSFAESILYGVPSVNVGKMGMMRDFHEGVPVKSFNTQGKYKLISKTTNDVQGEEENVIKGGSNSEFLGLLQVAYNATTQ